MKDSGEASLGQGPGVLNIADTHMAVYPLLLMDKILVRSWLVHPGVELVVIGIEGLDILDVLGGYLRDIFGPALVGDLRPDAPSQEVMPIT